VACLGTLGLAACGLQPQAPAPIARSRYLIILLIFFSAMRGEWR